MGFHKALSKRRGRNSDRIIAEYNRQMELYRQFTERLRDDLELHIKKARVSVNAVTSRLKSTKSLEDKLARKDDEGNPKYKRLCDVTDLAGVRIITYYLRRRKADFEVGP